MPLLKRFGVTSTCRASFGLYNGKDDVDALVEGIEKAQDLLRLSQSEVSLTDTAEQNEATTAAPEAGEQSLRAYGRCVRRFRPRKSSASPPI